MTDHDLIIVGGGPAGLTAAVYAIRRHLDVLLISNYLGGKTKFHIALPDSDTQLLIRGIEVVDRFRRELEYLDVVNHPGMVKSITKDGDVFTVQTGSIERTAKSVILATGAETLRLDVPGEEAFAGRGLSYSAISYAPLFVGKHTVVIGDGKLALRAVAALVQVAATVTLIAPTQGALDTPFAKKLIDNEMKVVHLDGQQVSAIQGEGFAQRVVLETSDGHQSLIEADGIFVELGLIPNSRAVVGLADLDEEERVIVDRRNQTSCPGLFAAGDVTNTYAEQVLIAVGDGAKAALGAYEYILSR